MPALSKIIGYATYNRFLVLCFMLMIKPRTAGLGSSVDDLSDQYAVISGETIEIFVDRNDLSRSARSGEETDDRVSWYRRGVRGLWRAGAQTGPGAGGR